MNRRYGKFLSDITENTDAVTTTTSDETYTDEVLRSLGYYPIREVEEMPNAQYWELRFTLNGDEIEQSYFVPQTYRTFSKLKILQTAAQLGLANDFLSLLKSDALLYEMWLAAQNIAEDNQFFQSGVETIKQQLHLTDEQIESILKEATI